ncbi:hypothetical protein PybrP1_004071 [[Pythium] brassicae (nom. inval.)]|nr:hypothetical protein PybrP1_004071 [[Pythium] brassicae (nom. inval.)]
MDMTAENPFADLMSKAVKLKGAQQAQLRTQFDSWPQYFQHSLFMQESVTSVRKLPTCERIVAAEAMKAAGNEHFNKNVLEEAVAEYEKALAVFKYIENKDPGWKKKGIEDADLVVVDHKCDTAKDQRRLDALMISCYLNIAVSKFKLKDHATCVRACDDTLLLDPRNVKAYYRRAQALITPVSSGALEFDQAIASLEKAYGVDPSNKEVRKLLRELKEQKLKQKKLDRETFSGMFNRGQVYDDDEASTDSLEDVSEDDTARERKFRKELNEAEALARMCESKGQLEHAKEIRAKIAEAKAARTRRLKQVDFFHPTDEMVEDAKKNGIDLTDPSVQQMLHELQEKERNKTSSATDGSESQTADPGDASVGSIDAILDSMSDTQIAQMLAREGIDYGKITDREHFLETARQVVASKLSATTDTPRSDKSYFLPIFVLAAAWTLLRLYTTGGLSFLYRVAVKTFSGGGAGEVDSDSTGASAVDELFFGE